MGSPFFNTLCWAQPGKYTWWSFFGGWWWLHRLLVFPGASWWLPLRLNLIAYLATGECGARLAPQSHQTFAAETQYISKVCQKKKGANILGDRLLHRLWC
jgi:hypothetical protein